MKLSHASLGLCAALAFAAPAAAADFAVVSQTATGGVLIDRSTVARNGDARAIRTFLYANAPFSPGPPAIHWVEIAEEYDCAKSQVRGQTVTLFDLTGAPVPRKGGAMGGWIPLKADTPGKAIEDLLCRDQGGQDLQPVETLQAFQARFSAAPLDTPAETAARAAPLSNALTVMREALKSAGSNQRAGEIGPPHYFTDGAPATDSAGLIDVTSRRRNKDRVFINRVLLVKQPVEMDGAAYQWIDNIAEYDCAAHRMRQMVTGMHTRDRSSNYTPPKPAFGAWRPIEPDSYASKVEDLICRNAPNPGMRAVADLATLELYFLGSVVAADE